MEYLAFEKSLEELIIKLEKAKELGKDNAVDASKTVMDIEKQIASTRKEIYENLSSWEKVQLSRHPQRPYSLDYISALSDDTFLELLLRIESSISVDVIINIFLIHIVFI